MWARASITAVHLKLVRLLWPARAINNWGRLVSHFHINSISIEKRSCGWSCSWYQSDQLLRFRSCQLTHFKVILKGEHTKQTTMVFACKWWTGCCWHQPWSWDTQTSSKSTPGLHLSANHQIMGAGLTNSWPRWWRWTPRDRQQVPADHETDTQTTNTHSRVRCH